MDHRAILISDNAISREGLIGIISRSGFEVVQSDTSKTVALDRIPDEAFIIIDLGHPKSAAAIIDRIHTHQTSARCVVLVDKFSFEDMMECFQNGAHGFLVKSMNCSQLVASLQLAALGERVMPSELIDVLSQIDDRPLHAAAPGTKIEASQLSNREMDVLCCLAVGQSNKEIARQLYLSEATVKVHVKAILRKLKVANRTQAAMWSTAHRIAPRSASQGARQTAGSPTL